MGYSIEYDACGEPDRIGPIKAISHMFADGSWAVVSRALYRMMYGYRGLSMLVGEVADFAEEHYWEGIGLLLDHAGEPVVMDTDAESQWFSSRNHIHACQLVREQANAEYIRTRLTEADERDRPYADAEAGESALYEVDGHLFFDLGAENIVHEVLRVQSALSGHPLLDEDRAAVLEDGILSRHIESEVGALDLDEKVDSAAIEETYRAHAEAMCPDCAEVDMAEVLDECGITECTDCGTLHNRDDSTKTMDGSSEVLCPECGRELRDSLEEADGAVEDMLGWELRTGRGIKIRTDDGAVQRWDGVKWSPSTLLPGEFCINEVKW